MEQISSKESNTEYDNLEKTADLQLAIEHGLAQRVYEIKNEQLLYSKKIYLKLIITKKQYLLLTYNIIYM